MHEPTLSLDRSYSQRTTFHVDAVATALAPAYPALFAAVFGSDLPDERVALRVRAHADSTGVLGAQLRGDAALAVVSAQEAVRALAAGLPAMVVSAAVAAAQLPPGCADDARGDDAADDAADIDDEVPWLRLAALAGDPLPSAVILAPSAALAAAPDRVADALRAYWRSAEMLVDAPALLGVVLASECGVSHERAARVARAEVARWNLTRTVSANALRAVAAALRARGELLADVLDVGTRLDLRWAYEGLPTPRPAR